MHGKRITEVHTVSLFREVDGLFVEIWKAERSEREVEMWQWGEWE